MKKQEKLEEEGSLQPWSTRAASIDRKTKTSTDQWKQGRPTDQTLIYRVQVEVRIQSCQFDLLHLFLSFFLNRIKQAKQ